MDRERRELAAANRAVAVISDEPIGTVVPEDAMRISELAEALGVRPSTLRHWEAEGLIKPDRDRYAARSFAPEQVRDARIVHQLRLAGYRIDQLRELMPVLRRSGRSDEITAALTARSDQLTVRSRRLVHGAAALSGLLDA